MVRAIIQGTLLQMTHPSNARYKEAGVDIDAGNALVDKIKPLAKATTRPGIVGGLGGFGALFDLKAAGFEDALLVSTTDGVGTKLKLAQELAQHRTIGIDLVGMCVNDLIVQGATPLFFLDYYATGKLDVVDAAQVIAGIAEGCSQGGCALVGGETAEMPGMYQPGDYDLAGFSVGAVARTNLLPKPNVGAGNVLLGLGSSGVHSNGYSLVRKIVADSKADLKAPAPFDSPYETLGDALLTPTRIYVKSLLPSLNNGDILALAHITGGGLTENLPRVLPNGINAKIDLDAWKLPPVFAWMQQAGDIATAELLRTFNCGIGMILVVEESKASLVANTLAKAGETVVTLGSLTTDAGDRVQYNGALCAA